MSLLNPRQGPARASTIWRFAQRFFLAAGLLALGFTAYTYATRSIYQTFEAQTFEANRFDHDAPSHAAAAGGSREPGARQPLTPIDRSLIGRIEIPRLGISAMIKEGVDRRTLNLAVGHIPSTALPGQIGNVGVAAHRDHLFRNLKDVKQDDEITLTTLDNTYVYRVVSIRVVNPGEISVLAASGNEKTLTLVTCYPFYFVGPAASRFIVRARQVTVFPTTKSG